ncbi:MAG: pentose kinase [Ruminococcaceae bacterium]|nr:pentose kinase [Oscillospiraceae bacterium]
MNIIAYDLGTGGVKASLYDNKLQTLAKVFLEYNTFYPTASMHEQRPLDWWNAICESTKKLLDKTKTNPHNIECVSLSGASLVAIPMDKDNNPLLEQVPIWSDTRAEAESEEFFSIIDRNEWYMTTGNGFPAPCYSIFKLMWLKKHMPDVFEKTAYVLGSKDYINFMLTGNLATDFSYASGTGAYELKTGSMKREFLRAAGLSEDIFLEPVVSHKIIGSVTEQAAQKTGLCVGTKVVCGGVDNACMALGAVGPESGKAYVSLGSSSWIPVNSQDPVLDVKKKPYVFAHIQEGMFTSAFSIFAGGSSLRWARDTLFADVTDDNIYITMDKMADKVPIGSNGILFNPSLAGGTSQDKSIHIRGAYVGLHLGTTRDDMVRATMEGIALNLRMSLQYLKEKVELSDSILFCGGGSKSPFWMQMFADVFNMPIAKSNIDQDAASLGAAAIAARGIGIWKDYSPLKELQCVNKLYLPCEASANKYDKLFTVFTHINEIAAELGDYMQAAMRKVDKNG